MKKLQDLKGQIEKVATFLGKSLSEEQLCRLTQHLRLDDFAKNKAVNYEICKEFSFMVGKLLNQPNPTSIPPHPTSSHINPTYSHFIPHISFHTRYQYETKDVGVFDEPSFFLSRIQTADLFAKVSYKVPNVFTVCKLPSLC